MLPTRRRPASVNLTRLLHLLPPETAHRTALGLLPWLPPAPAPDLPRLRVRLAGLELAHPLGLAAGFDKDGQAFAALLRQGFAFVEIGTVTPRPQPGNAQPRLFRLAQDRALVNRMGFNNAGAAALASRLAERDGRLGVVGVNIGMNKEAPDPAADYVKGMTAFRGLADYITVNVSSPNTPGLRALQKREALAALLEAVTPQRGAIPLFLKIAPDLDAEDEAAVAALCLDYGIDALIVGNTTVSRPCTLRSRHAGEAGGLSGRPLFPRSTRLLARMSLHLRGRLPLIAVGGIATGYDAYVKVLAGATALQLYTALVYDGVGLVGRTLRGLDGLLARDGYGSLAEAVGRDAATLADARVDRDRGLA